MERRHTKRDELHINGIYHALKSAESNVGHIRRPGPQREHIHNQRREEMRLSD
jgi:hypothetical protein